MSGAPINASRISRISLTSPDVDRLSTFYENAFGFRRTASERLEGAAFETPMGVKGGARKISLSLGDEEIELLEFDRPGRPYPDAIASSDLMFQHFAIVVADMTLTYGHLSEIGGWRGITESGPQRLPDSSGAVTAFKFRDPDGHPLELLAFAAGKSPAHWRQRAKAGPCLGIDHSAISVSDNQRSRAFYQRIGFQPAGGSINAGPEQEHLDALTGVHVEVSALTLAQATPHLELLCYRSERSSEAQPLDNNDVAATRLVLEVDTSGRDRGERTAQALLDPDGHHLMLIP
jgi:catechol 2,3-dioxygenase-like lactoylglutathione lyase family enzyme